MPPFICNGDITNKNSNWLIEWQYCATSSRFVLSINGIPRNTAEYIQASSRVGRKDKGLVVALFDSNRARDKSYFENWEISILF